MVLGFWGSGFKLLTFGKVRGVTGREGPKKGQNSIWGKPDICQITHALSKRPGNTEKKVVADVGGIASGLDTPPVRNHPSVSSDMFTVGAKSSTRVTLLAVLISRDCIIESQWTFQFQIWLESARHQNGEPPESFQAAVQHVLQSPGVRNHPSLFA